MITERSRKRLREFLNEELHSGEELIGSVFGQGLEDGEVTKPAVLLALTDLRVIVIAKSPLKKINLSWNHDQITAVGTGKGLLTGSLVFTVPGDQFTCKGLAKADAEVFRKAVEGQIRNHRTGPKTQAPPSDDASSRLEKLTTMHKQGLLTDDEFQAKRTKIIDSL